jgi:hypothetical protein
MNTVITQVEVVAEVAEVVVAPEQVIESATLGLVGGGHALGLW